MFVRVKGLGRRARALRTRRARSAFAPFLFAALQAGSGFAEEDAVHGAKDASSLALLEVRLWVDPHVSLGSVERLRADLEAGLPDQSHVRLSTTDSPDPGATTVSVRNGARNTVLVSVSIGRGKHATRELDLSGVPGDGHELTIAVIADELIRALNEAFPETAPFSPKPGAPLRAKDQAPSALSKNDETPSQSRVRLLAGGTGSAFTGGSSWLGGAVAVGWEHKQITIDGQFGFERSLDAKVSEGTILGELWSGELGLSVNILARSDWTIAPRCGLRAGALSFRGEALADAQSQTVAGPLIVPRVGLDAGYRSASFRLLAKLGLGATLAGVSASVDGEPAQSATGLEGWFGLMGGGAF